ncbi:hypothetical protein KQ940_01285 [Marinobacterium sp. D7]|uniref:YbhB/YbcL family Raf kinase inhibitor-like protein n=1 Tax=Marinobacterium ramblicola TaxID=2849041 RepID=UPI001C2D1CF3|nr:hypothetical protein [Marinobacterium ramblicola]MBV1786683.1 hypothetical protein [Marinobacterium ramblicola]
MRVINRKVLVHSLLWLSPLMLTGISAAESKEQTSTTEFKLSSPTLTDNGAMPVAHTCDGSRAVPEISWSSVPAGTQSLAMVMHHEAGPSDVHVYWVVYDIDPNTTHLGADVGSATRGVNTVDSQLSVPVAKVPKIAT